MKATPFASITKADALRLCATLAANAHRLPAVTLHGTFCARRFVIDSISPSLTPTAAEEFSFDYDTRSMSISAHIAADVLVREASRFGATVAAADRKRWPDFERVVDDANVRHWCQPWHHVALCGAKGGWGAHEKGSSSAKSCDACDKIATAPKTHRRRLPTLPNVPSASA